MSDTNEANEIESLLIRQRRDRTLVLILNRPKARNALNIELQGALIDAFREASADPEISAVILTGNGPAFCAGFDLKELATGVGGGDGAGRQNELAAAIDGCAKPILGAINGFAITGGFELALACDFLIASSDARFADTHTRVGMVPGWGLSQRLPRLIGIARAKELSLTGNFIDALQAERWGLVNRVVAPEELLPTCLALATDIGSCVGPANLETKRLIDAGFGMTLAEAMSFENQAATDWAKQVSGADIGSRREGVIDRGREQGR